MEKIVIDNVVFMSYVSNFKKFCLSCVFILLYACLGAQIYVLIANLLVYKKKICVIYVPNTLYSLMLLGSPFML